MVLSGLDERNETLKTKGMINCLADPFRRLSNGL